MTNILIVEDNPFTMELIVEILDSNGYCFDTAEDGKEAVLKGGIKSYDLILMDIQLPVMNGIDARRLIKSKPEYKNVPVIALTSFAMKGDKERFIAAGFDDYVSKPINIPGFIEKLKKYEKANFDQDNPYLS